MHTCWLTQIGCSSKTANHVAATQYIKHAGIVETFSFLLNQTLE
uniref:Uncharacterized protein n=1 Tax=Anguilla anguilla TaxID=7936 RepID=A0A0E9UGF5_ANGAN